MVLSEMFLNPFFLYLPAWDILQTCFLAQNTIYLYMGTASYEQLGVTEKQLVFITKISLIITPVKPSTYDLHRPQ